MKIALLSPILIFLILVVGCTKDDDPVSPENYLTIEKNAAEYTRYKYFFIDKSFEDNWNTPENYEKRLEHVGLIQPQYVIQPFTFELYVTRRVIGTQPQADIYLDCLNPAGTIEFNGHDFPNLYWENMYIQTVPDSLYSINYELGFIRLNSFFMHAGDILAVKYKKMNIANHDDIIQVGDVDSTGTEYNLQMLAEYDQNWDDPLNSLEWKNVYSLGMNNINQSDIKLVIYKNTEEGKKYGEYNLNSLEKPYLYWYEICSQWDENEVDPGFILSANGEFIFPNCRPFMPDQNSIIYDEAMNDSALIDDMVYLYNNIPSDYVLEFKLPK